jgi:hypothetical protein
MESMLKFIGGRPTIEVLLDTTGVNRAEIAQLVLELHRVPGAIVVFLNPSTETD